jgi:hypothetical protein
MPCFLHLRGSKPKKIKINVDRHDGLLYNNLHAVQRNYAMAVLTLIYVFVL